LTFESGSKLTHIGEQVFSGCSSLKLLCIPASYASRDSLNFHWLKDSSITSLSFESGSKLTRFEEGAFRDCVSLKSICLPAAYDSTDFQWLRGTAIGILTFESGSKLTEIDEGSFNNCWSLESICLPASVEILHSCCFSGCCKLSAVTFESGSKLCRIESGAFFRCSALYSISLPSSIEELCEDWLGGSSLRTVRFECGVSMRRMHELCLFAMKEGIQIEIVDYPPSHIFRDLPFSVVGSRNSGRILFSEYRNFASYASDDFSTGYDQCLIDLFSSINAPHGN
jgi:hypothetical protein